MQGYSWFKLGSLHIKPLTSQFLIFSCVVLVLISWTFYFGVPSNQKGLSILGHFKPSLSMLLALWAQVISLVTHCRAAISAADPRKWPSDILHFPQYILLNGSQVSCPGVHLSAKDDIYLSMCFMGQCRQSERLPAVFPLLVHEKMTFEKASPSHLFQASLSVKRSNTPVLIVTNKYHFSVVFTIC